MTKYRFYCFLCLIIVRRNEKKKTTITTKWKNERSERRKKKTNSILILLGAYVQFDYTIIHFDEKKNNNLPTNQIFTDLAKKLKKKIL